MSHCVDESAIRYYSIIVSSPDSSVVTVIELLEVENVDGQRNLIGQGSKTIHNRFEIKNH